MPDLADRGRTAGGYPHKEEALGPLTRGPKDGELVGGLGAKLAPSAVTARDAFPAALLLEGLLLHADPAQLHWQCISCHVILITRQSVSRGVQRHHQHSWALTGSAHQHRPESSRPASSSRT